MSSNSLPQERENNIKPRPYKPLNTLQRDIMAGDYQQPLIKRGPNIYKPVHPPLHRPIAHHSTTPEKQTTTQEPTRQYSNRLKVLENDSDDVFVLTKDVCNLNVTKACARPKSVKELREQERQSKIQQRRRTGIYPPGSYEANLQAILELRRGTRRNAMGDSPSTSKGSHDSTVKK